MIKIRRNCKRNEGKSFGARKVQKQGKIRGLRDFTTSAKLALCCETISQPQQVRCGIATLLWNSHFAAKPFRSLRPLSAKPFLAHECHFTAQWPSFHTCETAAKSQTVKIPNFTAAPPFRQLLDTFRSLPEVQIMHSISHLKAWEVTSPQLQTVLDLDLKRKSYDHLKMTVQTMNGNVAPPFRYCWTHLDRKSVV